MKKKELLDLITRHCREVDQMFPADRYTADRRACMALCMISGALKANEAPGDTAAREARAAINQVVMIEEIEATEVPQ